MISPIDLFNSLDKTNSTIKKLRGAQGEVLSVYAERLQDKARIGIKLPTGSGKSLIAILILEAWRRAGKVAAITTANKGLAEQIKRRCDDLKIPSATIFGGGGPPDYLIERTRNLRKYKLKQIIGIFNYHAFLYGTEYKQEIFPPDVLVIDDASDFETTRNDFFTVRIDREEHPKVYNAVLEALQAHSHLYPNLPEFARGKASQSKVELVYFTDVGKVTEVLQARMPELKEDPNFNFSFDRNRDRLSAFLTFITNNEIELRPLLIPEELLKMGGIQQIIFMSATLPDEELLHKIFGIGRSQIHMIDEKSISQEAFEEIETMGKRLIFPLDQTDLGVRVSKKSLDIILRLVKNHKKVLVLANSFFDTENIRAFLESQGIPVLICKNAGDSEHFAQKMDCGTLLCANRYLGLDFPGKTCKVEVIVRLPAIWDSVDAFQLSILGNNFYAEQRIGNRLTQSFGRCNRLEKDEALYFVLDSRILARFTGNDQYLRYLPRNMYSELMTGYALSQGGIIEHALEYGEKHFFGVDEENYKRVLKDEKAIWEPKQTKQFVSKYDLEIESWQKALVGNYENAGQLFDFVAEDYANNTDRFPDESLRMLSAFNYYLSAMCYYNAQTFYGNPKDKQQCLLALRKAIENGGESSWFNHLRAIYNSLTEKDAEKLAFDSVRIEVRKVKEDIAEKYEDFINTNSSKNKNWKDAFNQIISDVSNGSHGQMLVALRRYFELLGFETFLGDNSKGEPDIIAVTPPMTWKYQLAIEAKTMEKGVEESVASVTQVMGDAKYVERKTSLKTLALLVTQKETVSQKAIEIAKQQVRILSTSRLEIIMKQTLKAIDTWAGLPTSERTQFIDSIISHFELIKLFVPTDSPVLTSEDLNSIVAS
jgi:hypothetical protein